MYSMQLRGPTIKFGPDFCVPVYTRPELRAARNKENSSNRKNNGNGLEVHRPRDGQAELSSEEKISMLALHEPMPPTRVKITGDGGGELVPPHGRRECGPGFGYR
jgi:hypothetical protein